MVFVYVLIAILGAATMAFAETLVHAATAPRSVSSPPDRAVMCLRHEPSDAASPRIGPWSNCRTKPRHLRCWIMVSRSPRPGKGPMITSGARPGSWPVCGVPVPRRGGDVPLKRTADSANLSNVWNCFSGISIASERSIPT